MTPKVPIRLSGNATAGISVARQLRRNRKITPTTSTIDRISVYCTSATLARIVSVRSETMVRPMPAGNARCRSGSAARMRLTVCTMLAPGWRWMSSTTAGLPRYRAATRLFSTPPTTLPTSDSLTAAPLR